MEPNGRSPLWRTGGTADGIERNVEDTHLVRDKGRVPNRVPLSYTDLVASGLGGTGRMAQGKPVGSAGQAPRTLDSQSCVGRPEARTSCVKGIKGPPLAV